MGDTMKRSTSLIPDGMPEILESSNVKDDLGRILDATEYIRERANPRMGDAYYLHLSDLVLALKDFATEETLRILDFGCGGSPYKYLFPNSSYQRADIPVITVTDFQIDDDGRVNAPSGAFDLVLSTQVLEHCPNPKVYLEEARRMLRKGGRILLTTHGVFEDHGCPFDFLRWTSDGLIRELRQTGFDVLRCQKLTTAGRAIAFLMERHGIWFRGSRRSAFGILIRVMQRVLFFRQSWFHAWCDSSFSNNRVVDGQEAGHSMYIALLAVGVRND